MADEPTKVRSGDFLLCLIGGLVHVHQLLLRDGMCNKLVILLDVDLIYVFSYADGDRYLLLARWVETDIVFAKNSVS